MREPKRYLGLDLAGAKSERTALAALEFYPKENKIFLLDIFDRITGHDAQTSDEALLEVFQEMKEGVVRVGVNVPLTLPPCFDCSKQTCGQTGKCTIPAAKWMREYAKKAEARAGAAESKKKRRYHTTPYTQRPIELWIRYQVQDDLPEGAQFDVDEALGGTKAPLTARMHYLKRHLKDFSLMEVWPKLSVGALSRELGIGKRLISSYRNLEEGAHARSEILEALAHRHGVFIYDRDLRKLSHSLAAFDAFFCAYTALLSDTGRCARVPRGFPVSSGWVEYPRILGGTR